MVVETGRAEKLPPHDVEAEEAVIASLLVDPEAIYRVAPTLKPGDFFREKNAWAFEACLALWERNQSINQITVSHELRRSSPPSARASPSATSFTSRSCWRATWPRRIALPARWRRRRARSRPDSWTWTRCWAV